MTDDEPITSIFSLNTFPIFNINFIKMVKKAHNE